MPTSPHGVTTQNNTDTETVCFTASELQAINNLPQLLDGTEH
jgi:hypothetical protein